jgi:hypothetical protein
LDDVDALIGDMINEINLNASTISGTITSKADSVGYTISDTIKKTWTTSVGEINNVLTLYGGGIQTGVTNLRSALTTINTNISRMISQMNTLAGTSISSASISSVSNPSSSSYVTKSATQDETSTNDKSKNEKQESKETSIFDHRKDSYPKSELNVSQSIVDRLKYFDYDSSFDARRKYYSKMGFSGVYTSSYQQNVNMLEWMKKQGYRNGVYNLSKDELAWTQEGNKLEAIIRPSDGAILTPLAKNDSVLKHSATANLFNFANDPSEFIRNNLNMFDHTSGITNKHCVGSTYNNDMDIRIELPNVTNYEEFKYAMQHDKSFEKIVRAMTVDKMFGGSSLKKYKF